MTFFTSDLHLGHANVIRHCNRPFDTVEEMDAALIANWNRKVGRNDTVYVIGDIVWKRAQLLHYMSQLKGKKILLIGNHDRPWAGSEEAQHCFEQILPYCEAHLNSHPITMCHYPMVEWYASRKSDMPNLGYLIHGHIHNTYRPEFRYLFRQFNALNAGVDINHFEPVTFEELMENNKAHKLACLEDEDDRALLLEQYSVS